jgi:hypothetical protein
MTIYETKDFPPAKSDKIRLAVGRLLGRPGQAASKNEVNDALTQYCRDLVYLDDQCNYDAARPQKDDL